MELPDYNHGKFLSELDAVVGELQAKIQQEKGAYQRLQDELEQADIARKLLFNNAQRFSIEDLVEASNRHANALAALKTSEALIAGYEWVLSSIRSLIDSIQSSKSSQAFQTATPIYEILEAERLRISRDLHDGPAQVLANLVLEVEVLQKLASRDLARLPEELENFKSNIKTALSDMRRFIYELRPMTLDDLGLIPTLEKMTTEFSELTGISCQFEATGLSGRIASKYEEHIFRIVQEALNNVRKHANAHSVKVALSLKDNLIILNIKDDGKGFDVESVRRSAVNNRQFGLLGIQERVAILGGQLRISSDSTGTTIAIEVPYEAGIGFI